MKHIASDERRTAKRIATASGELSGSSKSTGVVESTIQSVDGMLRNKFPLERCSFFVVLGETSFGQLCEQLETLAPHSAEDGDGSASGCATTDDCRNGRG